MIRRFWIIPVLAAALVACERDMMSEKGFALPDGDAAAGREAFVLFQCYECHSIAGEEFPEIPGIVPPYVELGGRVTRVKTYGELVTAIINPSHKLAKGYAEAQIAVDGESKMAFYNHYMTVQELNDLVAYLQPHYDVVVPNMRYHVYP